MASSSQDTAATAAARESGQPSEAEQSAKLSCKRTWNEAGLIECYTRGEYLVMAAENLFTVEDLQQDLPNESLEELAFYYAELRKKIAAARALSRTPKSGNTPMSSPSTDSISAFDSSPPVPPTPQTANFKRKDSAVLSTPNTVSPDNKASPIFIHNTLMLPDILAGIIGSNDPSLVAKLMTSATLKDYIACMVKRADFPAACYAGDARTQLELTLNTGDAKLFPGRFQTSDFINRRVLDVLMDRSEFVEWRVPGTTRVEHVYDEEMEPTPADPRIHGMILMGLDSESRDLIDAHMSCKTKNKTNVNVSVSKSDNNEAIDGDDNNNNNNNNDNCDGNNDDSVNDRLNRGIGCFRKELVRVEIEVKLRAEGESSLARNISTLLDPQAPEDDDLDSTSSSGSSSPLADYEIEREQEKAERAVVAAEIIEKIRQRRADYERQLREAHEARMREMDIVGGTMYNHSHEWEAHKEQMLRRESHPDEARQHSVERNSHSRSSSGAHDHAPRRSVDSSDDQAKQRRPTNASSISATPSSRKRSSGSGPGRANPADVGSTQRKGKSKSTEKSSLRDSFSSMGTRQRVGSDKIAPFPPMPRMDPEMEAALLMAGAVHTRPDYDQPPFPFAEKRTKSQSTRRSSVASEEDGPATKMITIEALAYVWNGSKAELESMRKKPWTQIKDAIQDESPSMEAIRRRTEQIELEIEQMQSTKPGLPESGSAKQMREINELKASEAARQRAGPHGRQQSIAQALAESRGVAPEEVVSPTKARRRRSKK